MSKIDTSMSSILRTAMLSEVRSLLPAFLSAASAERVGAVAAAANLLKLPEQALQRVLAAHIMLSSPVRELVADLPTGMRRPVTASARPRLAGHTVSSGIDWAATIRHRATASPLGDIWVTRPANRIFDIPENRALAWTLRVLDERGTLAVPAAGEAPGVWGAEIRAMNGSLRKARQTAWVEAVPSIWPGDDAYIRLLADRNGFYRLRVTGAARYLRGIVLNPSSSDIVQALSERYFEPTQDWKLFEIAVLMRIARALEESGTRVSRESRQFLDGGHTAFARYAVTHNREVRLWYQGWPPSSKPSELTDAAEYYELPRGSNRPDIIVELVENGLTVRLIILELKASESSLYLRSGFSQLLGYLRDRPGLTSEPASGWLVAPPGNGYKSKDHKDRALWVVSSDDVANAIEAIVMRFANG